MLYARRRALHNSPAVSTVWRPARAAEGGRTCFGGGTFLELAPKRRFSRADPAGARSVGSTPKHASQPTRRSRRLARGPGVRARANFFWAWCCLSSCQRTRPKEEVTALSPSGIHRALEHARETVQQHTLYTAVKTYTTPTPPQPPAGLVREIKIFKLPAIAILRLPRHYLR